MWDIRGTVTGRSVADLIGRRRSSVPLHAVGKPGFTTMHAALTCSTERVRVGVAVCCAGVRHHGVIANSVTLVDETSAGRTDVVRVPDVIATSSKRKACRSAR